MRRATTSGTGQQRRQIGTDRPSTARPVGAANQAEHVAGTEHAARAARAAGTEHADRAEVVDVRDGARFPIAAPVVGNPGGTGNQLSSLEAVIRDSFAPDRMMRRMLDEALLIVPAADGAAIELLQGDTLAYVCSTGTLAQAGTTRLPVESSLSGTAVSSGRTQRCDDASQDRRVNLEACRRLGTVSMICVPLRHRGRPIGVLKVSSGDAAAFRDDDVSTLNTLADFVSAAISASFDIAEATENLLNAPGNDPEPLPQGSPTRVSTFVANVLLPGTASDVEARRRIEHVIGGDSIEIVFQPVIDLASGNLAGFEALSRFPRTPVQPPNVWFAEAARVGLAQALEMAAARLAVAQAPSIPAPLYLAVNLGPMSLVAPDVSDLVDGIDTGRLVIELTEHEVVTDYPLLIHAIAGLRERGVRLAVDDTGAGFASFSHILKLSPDVIKLDIELVRGIDSDPVRRSLATAVVAFGRDTGAAITAEGIETEAEMNTLRDLGVGYGQGYCLGRPGPLGATVS